MTLNEMIEYALEQGLDEAEVHDPFPADCELIVDGEQVAVLSLEDSGYGPLLWQLGIAVLKEARKKNGEA